MDRRLLTIYLNDQRAFVVAGVALARRIERENRENAVGAFLRDELLPALVDDGRALDAVFVDLRIRRSWAKPVAARAGEWLGRAKPNGRLRSYSPLSRVLELDLLALAIEAKRACWLTLASVHELDSQLAELAALAERAGAQRSRLEPFRLDAAGVAFGSRVS